MWERVYQQWKGKGIQFVGLGLLDSREACQAFVKKHGLTFPNGYDAEGKIARLYGFSYQPWWAVITKDGVLQKAEFGPSGEAALVSAVRALASER